MILTALRNIILPVLVAGNIVVTLVHGPTYSPSYIRIVLVPYVVLPVPNTCDGIVNVECETTATPTVAYHCYPATARPLLTRLHVLQVYIHVYAMYAYVCTRYSPLLPLYCY